MSQHFAGTCDESLRGVTPLQEMALGNKILCRHKCTIGQSKVEFGLFVICDPKRLVGRQGPVELAAGGDSELREDLAQVALHGVRADEQPRADLRV
jgi:hypothetical protein